MFNYSGLNEECGVFGIWNHPEAAQLTYMGLHSLQHRGQEGAGIVVSDQNELKGERGLGLLTEAIKDENGTIKRISTCNWSRPLCYFR